ncbi:diguanylate cyclase (GGDEF)-like protein [Pseudonocardia sediminis]|uniref:Diguanylate cyclase (GGDEF)-like protein n=1 Tax=Pseudonocardia sediminis TaxID=1397368 RepID=A0A4V2FQM3_PSEST|nr:GGDEF domain-containing protein [Pseudonocardia sediminis]RZT85270.1 diguanylate cyclase (GGDEF)-like protein [Pseudonocardia sediminis]
MTATTRRLDVRRWPVWALRPRMLVLLLLVDLAAAGLVSAGLVLFPPGRTEVLGAVGLAVLGIVHTELATGIERVRRRVAHSSYFDLSSVWTFAAALLLPAPLAGTVVLAVYAHLWFRVWRPAGAPLFRHLYTTATVVLAVQVAGRLLTPETFGAGPVDPLVSYPALIAAMVLYVLVNQVLVGLAMSLSAERRLSWRDLVGDWDDHVLEGATLCLAVLASVAVLRQPLLVLLVLPPLLVLHRAVLIRQLEERANTDAKTGLLTSSAWRGRATRSLLRARRNRTAVAVLILDLDHFKTVNDTYGHIAGDEVLGAVASTLLREVRDGDLVGRFGGEEFVVLLSGLPVAEAGRVQSHAAAERIRRTVRTLAVDVGTPDAPVVISDLSVSVGAALSDVDGNTIDDLMQIADYALYAAKRGGRNQVRLGRPDGMARRTADDG